MTQMEKQGSMPGKKREQNSSIGEGTVGMKQNVEVQKGNKTNYGGANRQLEKSVLEKRIRKGGRNPNKGRKHRIEIGNVAQSQRKTIKHI